MTLPRKFIFIPDSYYHIYNRGHNKQPIFLNYKDYMRYFLRLKEYLTKYSMSLIAYCLMPNHIHLLLKQEKDTTIDKFIHRLHTAYTMYFNKKYNRFGAAFQGRFKAIKIESDEYLLHLSRYIHLNPLEILRAQAQGLRLEDYQWSSYSEFIRKSKSPVKLCKTEIILNYFSAKNTHLTYENFVEAYIDDFKTEHLKLVSAGDFSTLKPWA